MAKAQDVAQASTLELPGIFAGLADGVLRLTNGIAVPVPEGQALERYAGDEARLLVSLGPDGSFTLIAIDKELEAMGYAPPSRRRRSPSAASPAPCSATSMSAPSPWATAASSPARS